MVVTAALLTECSQIPALMMSDGSIKALGPEFKHCPDRVREQVAQFMGGEVVWLKVEVQYYKLQHELCTKYDCYALARNGQGTCGASH